MSMPGTFRRSFQLHSFVAIRYCSQVTWQTSASSEIATRKGMDIARGCRMRPQCTDSHSCMRASAHTSTKKAEPNCIGSKTAAKLRQQIVCVLIILFMNVGELVEWREGIDKLLILRIPPIESRVLSHVIVRACAHGCTRLMAKVN